MRALLAELGCESEESCEGDPDRRSIECSRTLRLHSVDDTANHARYDIVRTMRAGVCALGPMLAKRGAARVSMPGGCVIGDRPMVVTVLLWAVLVVGLLYLG